MDSQSIAPFLRAMYPSTLVAMKTENLAIRGILWNDDAGRKGATLCR
jgi:hypothetical protein